MINDTRSSELIHWLHIEFDLKLNLNLDFNSILKFKLKGMLNTDTSPRNFWTTFLENKLTEKLKKSAVANAIAISFALCFSCFVLLSRFRENLTKPFYFYLSHTCGSPNGTPSVISLALSSMLSSILWLLIRSLEFKLENASL